MTRDELIAAQMDLPRRVALNMGLGRRHDFDDLVQAGLQALIEAADAFDPALCHNGEAGFGPYAVQKVRWRYLQELRRENRHAMGSLDAALGDGMANDSPATLGAMIADRNANNPADCASAKEQMMKRGYHALKLSEARDLTPRPDGVGEWAQRLREAAFNAVSETDMTELMASLLARAKAGDLAAARLVLGYLTGGGAPRVQQVVMVQQNVPAAPPTGDLERAGEGVHADDH